MIWKEILRCHPKEMIYVAFTKETVSCEGCNFVYFKALFIRYTVPVLVQCMVLLHTFTFLSNTSLPEYFRKSWTWRVLHEICSHAAKVWSCSRTPWSSYQNKAYGSWWLWEEQSRWPASKSKLKVYPLCIFITSVVIVACCCVHNYKYIMIAVGI